jgi:hypothetical protein
MQQDANLKIKIKMSLKGRCCEDGKGYETGSGSYPLTNFGITEPPVSESGHDAHPKEWRVIKEMLNRRYLRQPYLLSCMFLVHGSAGIIKKLVA